MHGKAHELDRSKRLSERKHKTLNFQLNHKDFKNLSGDNHRTIIWKVQNNELNRQINVITTNAFNCVWELQN